jgi:MFS family permease
MKGGIRITAVTTILHFLVDGLCVCCLYMMIPFFHSAQIMAYIFVYNVLAFMSQPLTGIMVDMLERKDKMLCVSVVGLLLAVCAVVVLPFIEGKLLRSVGFVVSVLLGNGKLFVPCVGWEADSYASW